jgi:hypothetical protein
MEAGGSSETSVTVCLTTLRYIPGDSNVYGVRPEILKPLSPSLLLDGFQSVPSSGSRAPQVDNHSHAEY